MKHTDYTDEKTKITQIPDVKGLKVIISGIGTGGHYFPALVVAQEFLRRNVEVIFLVRKGYSEEKVGRMHNLKILTINAKAFFGKSIFGKILSMLSIAYSVLLLNAITKGKIGLAFGGFGALPLLVSCFINRSPFYLFEPNRIPGRATKLFAARAKKVFLGLPLLSACADRSELKGNLTITGVPVREEFKTYRMISSKKNELRRKVVFLGGSQGARRLNQLALGVQEILPKEYKITIICGKRDYSWVNNKRNGRTTVIPFTFAPWRELHDADVIVSRSGALAGYEILALNKPAIFIPFPYAIDNHQYYNAEYFSKLGNTVVIQEKELTGEIIVEKIMKLVERTITKKNMLELNAEKIIVDVVVKENLL